MSDDSRRKLGFSCADLARYFDTVVVPKAQQLGLMDGLTYEGYLEKLVGDDVEGDKDAKFAYLRSVIEAVHKQRDVKSTVRFHFVLDVLCVGVLRPKGVGSAPLVNRDAVLRLEGYLDALIDMKADTVRRGANGRRLIGATSRDRARKAAEGLRGTMSKDSAAPLIAEIIGKQPSTVRRMLSELFPGDAWSGAKSDESTDE